MQTPWHESANRATTAMTSMAFDRVLYKSPLVAAWLRLGGTAPSILPVDRIGGTILMQPHAYAVEDVSFWFDGQLWESAYPMALYLPILVEKWLSFARIVTDHDAPRLPTELGAALAALSKHSMVRYTPEAEEPWEPLSDDDWLRVVAPFSTWATARLGFYSDALDLASLALEPHAPTR